MKAVFFCSLKTPGTGVRFLITKKQARLHRLDTYCVTNEDQHLLFRRCRDMFKKFYE